MRGEVNLLTTNLITGEKTLTKGLERVELEKWIIHQKANCAEDVLDWEIVEVGE